MNTHSGMYTLSTPRNAQTKRMTTQPTLVDTQPEPREVELPPVPFARSQVAPEALENVMRVLQSGWLTTGPEVLAFERDVAEWVGAANAVAVSSCTAAIELSLRAMGLPRGAKVLTSTMTFCGAVHAIVHAGLTPVFVDVNPATQMPDAATTAAAVRRAGPVDAMVALHFAGYPAPVAEMADAAGLPLARVIEDGAHALGTVVEDRPVGTISSATCFSFYATKNLPIGEGGMVTTDDPEIADYVRRTRLHGMSRDAWKRYGPGASWRYEVSMAGLKANMTDMQAAIGRAQLGHFPDWQAHRARLADRYDAQLQEIPGIRPAARPASGRHAWHIYVIRVEPSFGIDRDTLSQELAARGIGSSVHFIPNHQHPYFAELLGSDPAEFPGAEHVFPQILSLPLHPGLTEGEVDRVCSEIADLHTDARARLVSTDEVAGRVAGTS
jgi:dTDP-4-amino-4,6-dideoxygalactose transaminase